MVRGQRGSKQIKHNAQPLKSFDEARVITVDNVNRLYALAISPHRNSRAVAIAPTYHQNLIALGALETSKSIGRDIHPSHVTDMKRPIGIRPGHAHQNMFYIMFS